MAHYLTIHHMLLPPVRCAANAVNGATNAWTISPTGYISCGADVTPGPVVEAVQAAFGLLKLPANQRCVGHHRMDP